MVHLQLLSPKNNTITQTCGKSFPSLKMTKSHQAHFIHSFLLLLQIQDGKQKSVT